MASGLIQFIKRWRSADRAQLQLDTLIAHADPLASLEDRNAWLIELGYWWRSDDRISDRLGFRSPRRNTRLRYLLQVLERDEQRRGPVVETLRSIFRDLDGVSLLCDTGLPQHAGFWAELRERSVARLIPATPNTREWGSLLSQLFPTRRDVEWLEGLDADTWARIVALFADPKRPAGGHAVADVMHGMRLLISQVRATALSSAIRSRMESSDFAASPYVPLESHFDALLEALAEQHASPSEVTLAVLMQRLNLFRALLEQCGSAIRTVFEHLDDHGVSVDIEFRVEGILARLERIEDLLPLLVNESGPERRPVLIELLRAHQASQSNIRLMRQSFGRLARKVVDRSAETGEHYITRTWSEYRHMFIAAAGGGALTGITVYLKFFIVGWHLPPLFEGLLASLNYAVSFVVLQLIGFTLATKQPAMTAPALAARIDRIHQPDGMTAFVEETLNLLRSQAVSVFGNVALVVPVCWLAEWLSFQFFAHQLITPAKALATIDSFSILGATPFYAALTGVLLWSSSLIAGWVDNWFVYRRIGDVIAHHRRTRLLFGAARAGRFANYMRSNISAFAGNISLGFLLGMTPFVGALIALPLEVRHVTLSAGGVFSAIGVLGFEECKTLAFWLAIAGILSMALLNVGVSFMLAFQLALRSRALPRSERYAIYRALLNVLLRRPQAVLMMPRQMAIKTASSSTTGTRAS
jgi:site-specific recombinase